MTRKSIPSLVLALAFGLGLTLIILVLPDELARAADSTPPTPPDRSELSSQAAPSERPPDRRVSSSAAVAAPAANVLEVFTNTWSYSTLGLVYDPGRDHVRYAHESQSSTHNPTIYDADAAVPHTVAYSVSLSTQNSGWPWQIDNRDGAGYDFVADTYFLPDYNGDLSYADDNIVEVNVNGTVLNAWEMDDEVGSNDSSDGSEIDCIIDIAIVPGTPTRYFATAAYDGDVVYEIVLTRTNVLWAPNSWRTVMTYTLGSGFEDNLGIDYDAENNVLYHSSWDTTTLMITDLAMNPIASFDCPGAGGYNSGVTFIEGSSPPQVWVTDFSSDQTTVCQSPIGSTPPGPGWEKQVEGQPWATDMVVATQTGQVVQVIDVITATQAFTLMERWDPDQLALVGVDVFPPVGQIITGVGLLDFVGPAGPPEVVQVMKWFHVEPCDWLTTTLEEFLVVEGAPPFEARPVTITKLAPELHIRSVYETEVYAGSIVSFTLQYSNTGGFENDVWIQNTFPVSAPFVYAEPFPDYVGPDGLSARWDLGDLAMGAADRIDVYVLISATIPDSRTIPIWDGIFNHVDVLQEETWTYFHVQASGFAADWRKTVNGLDWRPGISLTLETSQTLVVEEYVDPLGAVFGFGLLEEWNPDELRLLPGWTIEPIAYEQYITTPVPGLWILEVPATVNHGPFTITKEFRVEPCTWPETILWESLWIGAAVQNRPVVVSKRQPELWIDSFFDVSVYSGDEAQFVLAYGNDGGFENAFSIRNEFPPTVEFLGAQPAPTGGGPGDPVVEWDFLGGLTPGEKGYITVTVEITPGLPPSTTIEIWDGIFNHVDEFADETVIAYHVPPPAWDKWVNGTPWNPDLGVLVQTGDIITVTDVISTRSGMAIVEHWNPERLALTNYITNATSAGTILSDTGFLSWEFPGHAPGPLTITKIFHVEPCTWTYTVLWEELVVENVEWERRPVHIDRVPANLWIEGAYEEEIVAGQWVTIPLAYGNLGGLESWAWVTSTFPAEAPFAWSDPVPADADPGGRWARWDVGALAQGEEDHIAVTVAITDSLKPGTTIHIYGYIYDHVDVERDWIDIPLRGPTVYLPLVLRSY